MCRIVASTIPSLSEMIDLENRGFKYNFIYVNEYLSEKKVKDYTLMINQVDMEPVGVHAPIVKIENRGEYLTKEIDLSEIDQEQVYEQIDLTYQFAEEIGADYIVVPCKLSKYEWDNKPILAQVISEKTAELKERFPDIRLIVENAAPFSDISKWANGCDLKDNNYIADVIGAGCILNLYNKQFADKIYSYCGMNNMVSTGLKSDASIYGEKFTGVILSFFNAFEKDCKITIKRSVYGAISEIDDIIRLARNKKMNIDLIINVDEYSKEKNENASKQKELLEFAFSRIEGKE